MACRMYFCGKIALMRGFTICVALCLAAIVPAMASSPELTGLLERISEGLSEKMATEIVNGGADTVDFFELTQLGGKPAVRGNNAVSVAVGVNYYLRHYTGNHLSWNNMRVVLPDTLPAVTATVRRSTPLRKRYYMNYCTHSYSAAFWDWPRWEREIDWMALHGINMPLAVTGSAALWRNVLRRLEYPETAIDSFVAGPGYQAWWLMNNLEGWGGPNPAQYYERDEQMQRRITGRMRELGMEPVLPGYSGMLPHDAAARLGLDVADPGRWCGYGRPAFLQPSDTAFNRIADIYYDELTKLYGTSRYYSMDPFHEGGNTAGVDLAAAGRTIAAAMKRCRPDAVWVVQGWQENPRPEMIAALPEGDMTVLDLQAENSPAWCARPDGFAGHDWLYCMLLNFGGNVGMYGKMQAMADGFARARRESASLAGVGLTMEGIDNNPVMYELLCDLPWMEADADIDAWLGDYVVARYGGVRDDSVDEAWRLLKRSAYGCPADTVQQGSAESLFCARPADGVRQVSTWAATKPYYDPDDVRQAAELLLSAAGKFGGNANYVYDLVDVTRQAVADEARAVMRRLDAALAAGDREAYSAEAERFQRLIDVQDSLLGTLPDFRLGRWLEQARACGDTQAEKELYERNARTLITTWGNRGAADGGMLHDYAHREWQGLLHDFYLPRWKRWFDARLESWPAVPVIDFYPMEAEWTGRYGGYSSEPEGDQIEAARAALNELDALDAHSR